MRSQSLGASIEGFAVSGFRPIYIKTHIHVLRALPRKHEYDGGGRRCGRTNEDTLGIWSYKPLFGIHYVSRHYKAPVCKCFPSSLRGKGNISEAQVRMLSEVIGEVRRGTFECSFALRGQGHQLILLPADGRFRLGCLLKHGVRIRAANTERGYTGATRCRVRLPISKAGAYVKWAISQIDQR